MKGCPVCSIPMDEVNKSGVMIDVCPRCKGVWLDRGELNRLMEGLGGYRQEYDEYERRRYYDDDDYKKRHHKKRGVFDVLGDLFD